MHRCNYAESLKHDSKERCHFQTCIRTRPVLFRSLNYIPYKIICMLTVRKALITLPENETYPKSLKHPRKISC